MATLQIRKETTKVWRHVPSDELPYIVSKLYIKSEGDNIRVVELGGSQRGIYNFADVSVYDIGGVAETFTSASELMQRLEALGYVGFFYDGEVSPSLLISSDVGNAITLGSDGKLYVSVSGGGSWGSISGTLSDQTDLKNALDLKLDKVTTAGVERVYTINADGSQGTKPTSDFKDVIEGYFNGTNFYTDAGFTNLITPESGKIYVNIAVTPATQYRWSGSAYVQIGGSVGGTTKIIGLVNDAVTVLSSFQTGGVNTIMHSFLIPANEISNSLIEVDYFAVRTLGTTNPTLNFNLYLSNNNDLTGGIAITIIALNGTATGQQIRFSFFTEENKLYRFTENIGASYYAPASVDFTQPVYFHFYINNGGAISADSTRYFRHINVKAIKSI